GGESPGPRSPRAGFLRSAPSSSGSKNITDCAFFANVDSRKGSSAGLSAFASIRAELPPLIHPFSPITAKKRHSVCSKKNQMKMAANQADVFGQRSNHRARSCARKPRLEHLLG